jgi:hypothetical protein
MPIQLIKLRAEKVERSFAARGWAATISGFKSLLDLYLQRDHSTKCVNQ